MVRPSAPRFLNFGDKFELPVIIQNQTDAPADVGIVIRATNATIEGETGKRVKIAPNDRVEVRFNASAMKVGTARFQFGIASGNFSDASQIELPVWTPATTEAFATYGEIDEGAIAQPVKMPPNVFPQFGGLEITTSSTQLQALTDAVVYLVKYPYECNEQLASRVVSIAALRDVLSAFKAAGPALTGSPYFLDERRLREVEAPPTLGRRLGLLARDAVAVSHGARDPRARAREGEGLQAGRTDAPACALLPALDRDEVPLVLFAGDAPRDHLVRALRAEAHGRPGSGAREEAHRGSRRGRQDADRSDRLAVAHHQRGQECGDRERGHSSPRLEPRDRDGGGGPLHDVVCRSGLRSPRLRSARRRRAPRGHDRRSTAVHPDSQVGQGAARPPQGGALVQHAGERIRPPRARSVFQYLREDHAGLRRARVARRQIRRRPHFQGLAPRSGASPPFR